jgi:2-polyprenyl-6-methoxyphenol hydroxylase-like FAD-dependent oxidoreductase
MASLRRLNMRQVDIAIVGGGLAGSTAAAMLGRAGIDAVLIDPHARYPEDLRCEKLDGSQVAILEKTGLAPEVLRATTYDRAVWVARFGRLVEKRASDQHGILYDDLVNTMRGLIPERVPFIEAKVTAARTGDDRQALTLSNGEEISARLIVLAHGLNIGFAHGLGLTREIISPGHSITLGFDVAPVGRPSFDFPALSYWPERASDNLAYLSLFPIGPAMRANFMVYRDMRDPWLKKMRTEPVNAILEVMPGLKPLLGDFAVPGFVKIRPADLYRTNGVRQPGIVLVGDAFSTSCPAAGTGTTKVFTDVERLCNVHIPRWLASAGMAAEKIGAFYDDPVKQDCEQRCLDKAFWLRSLSTESGLTWKAQRWARFAVGSIREARHRITAGSPGALNPT